MNERKNPFVFVVDDDASMRDSLSDLLGSAGLNVQTFAISARVLGKPASGRGELPGARRTAAWIKRS